MAHSADQIAADVAAIKQGKSPETGEALAPGQVEAHIALIWGDARAVQPGSDAARRIAALRAYATGK